MDLGHMDACCICEMAISLIKITGMGLACAWVTALAVLLPISMTLQVVMP